MPQNGEKMIIGAVLASGTGSRMKSDIPKQFLGLCGKPVFLYSVEAFLKSPLVDCVIVCVSEEYSDFAKKCVCDYLSSEKEIVYVAGGNSRGESLLNVLRYCDENNMLDSIILTHDSVRPFIDDEIIADSIDKCREYGAAITCKPATDTIFITDSEGKFIRAVPDRPTVCHAQTPQTFRTNELYDAIKSLPESVYLKMTDAGSVYAYCGKTVAVAKGSEDNIKITYPGDLPLAESIAERLKLCQH